MSRMMPRKPYYTLAELCERWSLSPSDIAAYALEGEITLSLPVAALRVAVSQMEADTEGQPFSYPCGERRHVGTMDLQRIDAYAALERGQVGVVRFLAGDGEVLEPIDADGEPCPIAVDRATLVVRHAELERFEATQVMLEPLGPDARVPSSQDRRARGAPPKFDWENALLELLVMINDEGVPETQAELVARVRDWFARQVGPDHVPCDSSIKRRISRVWPRIKPLVGKPSALRSIHAPVAARAPEKKPRADP
jgi:hypothetical protein